MTDVLYREDILANRTTWCDFLEQPERIKAKEVLDAGGGARCCIGHGACALGLEAKPFSDEEQSGDDYREGARFSYGAVREALVAPRELINLLGLHDGNGRALHDDKRLFLTAFPEHTMLASVNDDTELTTQQIGAGIRTMIEGGLGTPFIALADYPERPVA